MAQFAQWAWQLFNCVLLFSSGRRCFVKAGISFWDEEEINPVYKNVRGACVCVSKPWKQSGWQNNKTFFEMTYFSCTCMGLWLAAGGAGVRVPSIHPEALILLGGVVEGCGSWSQLTLGKREGTTWTGCQSITGLTGHHSMSRSQLPVKAWCQPRSFIYE